VTLPGTQTVCRTVTAKATDEAEAWRRGCLGIADADERPGDWGRVTGASILTPDIGGKATTREVADTVIDAFHRSNA